MTSSNMGVDMNVRKQRITTQAKKIILQVHKHLREQDEKISETDLEMKTAATTGVSISSLHRIKQQSKRGLIHSPPPRTRKAPVIGAVDDLKRDYIRREILSFYEREESPTIDALLKRIKGQPVGFSGCVSTLRKLVSQLGFRYKRVERNRFMLMEKDDIVAARSKYLRIVDDNRKAMNPKPEIYLDETWVVNPKENGKGQNLADSSVGSKQKTVKADRLGIVHAGCENGFIPEAFLSFRLSDGNKGNYYNIDHANFQCWFQEQLLPHIPPNSLIVMDNARCHSEFQDKAPTNNSKKWEVINWLTKHNISHDSSHTKSELLCLVKIHKHKQGYVIDEIAHNAGHEVVRIPLNHCLLNPIELIWDQVNEEIKNNYSYNKEKSFQEITLAAIKTITATDWKNCIQRTRKIENEYRKKDMAFEHVMENIENITCIAGESSDSDSDIYMDM